MDYAIGFIIGRAALILIACFIVYNIIKEAREKHGKT